MDSMEPKEAATDLSTLEEKEVWLERFLQQQNLNNYGSNSESEETLIDWLKTRHHGENLVDAFLVVLQELARSSKSGVPQRAEEWMNRLERMLSFPLPEQDDSNPNKVPEWLLLRLDECYHCVVQSWSNSPHEDVMLCVIRGERWFQKLHRPNAKSYHALLNACSKGRASSSRRVVVNRVNYQSGRRNRSQSNQLMLDHAKKAESILQDMKEAIGADTVAYNYVIRAWTKCRHTPQLMVDKTMNWLREMEQIQRKDNNNVVCPNTQSYSMALQAWTILAGDKARKAFTRDHHARKNPRRNGLYELEQVEALIQYTQDLYHAGHPHVIPDTVLYNIWISGWTRLSEYHPHGVFRAERVLRRMMSNPHAAPDHLSYTKVMLAWAQAAGSGGRRAAWWLSKLWNECKREGFPDHLRPRIGTYNTVMKAWRHTGDAAQQIERVFRLMDQHNHQMAEKNTTTVQPNTESFSHLIHAWLQNTPPEEGVRKAHQWLKALIEREQNQFKDEEVAPTAAAAAAATTTPDMYTGILKRIQSACVADSEEMLDIALDTLEAFIDSRHRLEWQVYAWTLEIVVSSPSLSNPGPLVQDLLQDCCRTGLLSGGVLRVIANGPLFAQGWTLEESRRVLQLSFGQEPDKEGTSDWSLPPDWTRNLTDPNAIPQPRDLQRTNFRIEPKRHET